MCNITINSIIKTLTLTIKTYKKENKKKIYLFFVFCVIIRCGIKQKSVAFKVAYDNEFGTYELSKTNKLQLLLKGIVIAFVFIGVISTFVFFIQTKMFPVKNLEEYLTNTNYIHNNPNEIIEVKPTEESSFFEFLIPASERENQILLLDMEYNNVIISINGKELLFQEAEFNLKPHGTMLSYNKTDVAFPITLSIIINPGGYLVMEDFPMIGQERNLMINARIKTLFNSFMFILVAGMGFLLAFILITIAFKNNDRLKSFLPAGIAMVYYGGFAFYAIFAYGGMTYYMKEVAVWGTVIPGYLASNLLFAGLEDYFLNKWTMSKIVFTSNLMLFPLLFFIPQISYLLIIGINFCFFGVLAYKSNMTLFSFLVFVRVSAEVYNLFAIALFPYWQLDLDGVTMFVMLFGVGYFFILDFNRQNEQLKIQSNELQVTNEQMYAMNEVLKDEYMEIEKINNSLEETIKERTSQLRKSMNSVKTLLNNTGEGFLKFNDSLLVEPEYSAECKKIFCKNIDYHFFPALIVNSNPDSIEMTTKILRKLLHEEDTVQRNVLFSLLPSVIESGHKALSLKYRLIEEEEENHSTGKKIMVIINDITKELSLQNKLKEEKELFEDILKLIAHYDEFHNLVEEYTEFWNKESHAIMTHEDLTHNEKRNELFRRIHTFKGSFAIFGMKRNIKNLHALETQLEKKDQDLEPLLEKIKMNKRYEKWLEKDMSKVYKYIQPDVLKKHLTTSAERKSIKQALEWLCTLQENENLKKAKKILRRLQLSPFGELFETHKLLFESTAQRMGILIEDLEINGEDILVDGERLMPLIRSWVHIFRNSLDHGIEKPEKRAELGKKIKGKISINVNKANHLLSIHIQDDGRGMDIEAISAKIQQKGLLSEKEIRELSEEQILNYIFEDGFSTKVTTSEISGRGIGLASVKKEVERLSGTVKVQSQKDIGTTFLFEIPTSD